MQVVVMTGAGRSDSNTAQRRIKRRLNEELLGRGTGVRFIAPSRLLFLPQSIDGPD